MKYNECPFIEEYKREEKKIFALYNNLDLIKKAEARHRLSNESDKSRQIEDIMLDMYSQITKILQTQKITHARETVSSLPDLEGKAQIQSIEVLEKELGAAYKEFCDYCKIMLEDYKELKMLVEAIPNAQ